MNIFDSFSGMVHLRLLGANPEETLHKATLLGIPILHIRRDPDPMARTIVICHRDYPRFRTFTASRGDHLEISKRAGVYWCIKDLIKRPALSIGIVFLLILTWVLPSRIFFLEVKGCETIPAKQIIAAAEEAGITFGVSRKSIRSEQVKNILLEALPQLQWVGVNTKGVLATITVSERQPETQQSSEDGSVCSIVAARDGVIQEICVERGSSLCQVGEVVKAGQLLISGYTDCGICVKATRASGEVYASTTHKLTTVTPTDWIIRSNTGSNVENISIIFGKKRINLFQSSGIFDTSCVKIYAEYDLTLPGGFSLPVSVAVEIGQTYEYTTVSASDCELIPLLSQYARHYITDRMVAGAILSETETPIPEDGVLKLECVYACREMIGQIRNEEIVQ